MHTSHSLAACLALTLVTACPAPESATPAADTDPASAVASQTPPPAPAAAKELIAASQPFGDFQFTYSSWTFPLDREVTHEAQLAMARDLEKEGWLRLRDGRVELTEKARQDKRFLNRSNVSVDIVPLARKEITEVSSVEPAEDGARAIVRWRWIPNEIGAAFTSGPAKERFDQEQISEVILRESSPGSWEVWSVRDPAQI